MRLNSGQPASERREGVKPRLALIGGVEAGATIADIQTTAATEQLLPLNPANRRIRTRTYGGVGGEESLGSPLSRFCRHTEPPHGEEPRFLHGVSNHEDVSRPSRRARRARSSSDNGEAVTQG